MTFETVESSKCSKVLSRVKSWTNPTEFKASKLRAILMGYIVTSTVGEICAYKLMQQDIRAGDLPPYSIDVAIITFALFEVLVAPFISWWGYRHRRALLIAYGSVASLCVLSWYFLPDPTRKEETKFCGVAYTSNSSLFLGVPIRTAVRLVLILSNCIVFVMTRVACWGHGIAYCEEFAPERTHVHYGVMLLSRTIPLILGYSLLTGKVETNMTFQTTTFLIGYVPNLIQVFLSVPKVAPIVKGEQKTNMSDYKRSFLTSLGRVASNPLAVSQIFAMGLLAVALYGYIYNEPEINKVKFNLVEDGNGTVQVTKLFHYFFVMFIVGFAGNLYSKPISRQFRRSVHMKQIIRSTIFVIVAYIAMTFIVGCDQGKVAGLSDELYTNPECSIACGCRPRFREFEPVCVVEEMVTYVSPCHAGCGGEELFDGVRLVV
ncbi:uncharacterized protein LOC112057741 [Bicyclus anynana]|uniref:Uncharacterized protein LOC112057741 n=1 Tax=Bicyclus anynana TaxID=110368 RepID=A0ABM3LYW1_BICAN|nr:uncharacterized protein LOC112057741 [Bicyclus anynana]